MVKAMYSVSRPLSDSLEDCGEELLGHLKHKRTDKMARSQNKAQEHAVKILYRQEHPQYQSSTFAHITLQGHTLSSLPLGVTDNLITKPVNSCYHLPLSWDENLKLCSPLPSLFCFLTLPLFMCVFHYLMV